MLEIILLSGTKCYVRNLVGIKRILVIAFKGSKSRKGSFNNSFRIPFPVYFKHNRLVMAGY